MNYDLPRSVTLGDTEYPIESDFRAVLDILAALDDPEMDDIDREYVALFIFYPGLKSIPPDIIGEAAKKMNWFVNGGKEETDGSAPKLVDWEQDLPLIIAAVNRVLGKDIRGEDYFHWWSFLSAYMEIGDCTFAQVVSIRDKLARGKGLDKFDREWYRRNQDLVDFKRKYTRQDDEQLEAWLPH